MSLSNTAVIILGPTAVGKTALAIEIAELLGTEIISADSRQCYRGMDIGTAKPSPSQLEQVKHHFINTHLPTEEVNAAGFEQYALGIAGRLFNQEREIVLVGGTGLYIKAFCEGLDDIPAIPATVRQAIMDNYSAHGIEWLQKEIQDKDPAFWQVAEQQNPQRLMRALEVVEGTGQSILDFRQNSKKQRPFRIVKIGLQLPRDVLYERIEQRVDIMISEGLVEEARSLLPFRHCNALQTVGYQELFEYFDGNISLETAISLVKQNTRNYAKRQLTWFRRDKDIHWFPPATPAKDILRQFDLL